MMRFDKLLCELNIGTRSEVKNIIKKGLVFVDGAALKDPTQKLDETKVCIQYLGNEYRYVKFRYFIMNKRPGVVTADTDKNDTTVMDDFRRLTDNQYKGYYPVGRLDKDTVGFLLITNDGMLSHKLLTPKGHVDKVYSVITDLEISEEAVSRLENGVEIEKDVFTLPARVLVDPMDLRKCLITIHEGKFHQVKRMFEKCGLRVMFLKRISFGPLKLDDSIPEGELRECTVEEIEELRGCVL